MTRSYPSVFNLKILSTLILISAACSCAFAATPTTTITITPITPMKLNLDTQDFLGNPDHQTFQVPRLGALDKQSINYTTNLGFPAGTNLYVKVSSVTFYADTTGGECSGNYYTLNLSGNTWWNSGRELSTSAGQIFNLSLYPAAIEAARASLGNPTVTCVQVQLQYKTGDAVGSYIVDTSANNVNDAPFELGNLIYDGTTITGGSVDKNSDTVTINSAGNFSVSTDGGTTPILTKTITNDGSTNTTLTIKNLGYGGLDTISAALSNPFASSGMTNNCSSQTLSAQGGSCTIIYNGNNTIPGVGAIILTDSQAQQSPIVMPFTVQKSGPIRCWGLNSSGQLGNASTDNSSTPVDVSNLTFGVIAMTAGNSHTCALLAAGGVQCWGLNSSGQLGDDSTTMRLTPVNVSGLSSGVIAITAGANHTCALLSSGGVKCWGRNSSGQLGDDSTTMRLTPVDVSGLSSGVIAVTAGSLFSCALLSTGGVKCWGNNNSGQLGNGKSGSQNNSSIPVDVSGLSSGVIAIEAGANHACALLETGGVKCWGANGSGQLGNGTTNNNPNPSPGEVSGLSAGVIAITAGSSHTCALLNTGTVKCWGANGSGQLGNGGADNSSTPVDVSSLTSAVAIMAGGLQTCALQNNGKVKCWGGNSSGQLGNGTMNDSPNSTPGEVSDLQLVTAITAGNAHTCAVGFANT